MYYVEVSGLTKKLCRSLKRGILYGLIDVLKAMLGFPPPKTPVLREGEFWALRDISFTVSPGETLGIIGNNGAGKTTLLRLLNGIYLPDAGSITLRGRVAPLIGVGSGFHPHMTGLENIMLNGTILGMSRKDVLDRKDAIVEFAGITDFLHAPVSTYSTGMRVRLGFAIAIHSPATIMFADEILSVCDRSFREKCYNKISQLRREGASTLLVSHNLQMISLYCDRVLVMDKGQQKFYGNTQEAISFYNQNFAEEANEFSGIQREVNGDDSLEIASVEFCPPLQQEKIHMDKTRGLGVKINCKSKIQIDDLYCEFQVKAPEFGVESLAIISNRSMGVDLSIRPGHNVLSFNVEKIPLHGGVVTLDLSIRDKAKAKIFCWKGIPLVFDDDPSFVEGWLNFDASFQSSSVRLGQENTSKIPISEG